MNRYNKSISKFQLDQRTALITGATRGIGWEIAKGIAEVGTSVYVDGRVKDILDSRCQELRDLGYHTKPAFFDATDTNADHIDGEKVKQFVEIRIPLKKWGQPEEIAGTAVFLSSDASSYITGYTLIIDAGLTVFF